MKSKYADRRNIPITLSCGCETVWEDGEDLYPNNPAWCRVHGDVDVESIDVPPEEGEK